MRTYEIRDWLKTLDVAAFYFSGKIDKEQEKAVCVYDDRMDGTDMSVCFGGEEYTKTHTFKATVVLQWNDNPRETEDAGYAFVEKLKKVRDGGQFYIGSHLVNHISVGRNEYGGMNENDLCQRVIYLDIRYSN